MLFLFSSPSLILTDCSRLLQKISSSASNRLLSIVHSGKRCLSSRSFVYVRISPDTGCLFGCKSGTEIAAIDVSKGTQQTHFPHEAIVALAVPARSGWQRLPPRKKNSLPQTVLPEVSLESSLMQTQLCFMASFCRNTQK